MLGAIVGAVASVASSIFGGSSKPQQTTTTNYVDYKRMVRMAEAAGFNPLTAIRNGGSAGFTVGTTTTPAAPLSARIADGVAGGVQSFLANFDPHQDQLREAEFKLVEAQLANLQADTSLKVQLGQVPSYTAGTGARRMGGGVQQGETFKSVTDVLPASAGAPQTTEIQRPAGTNPWGQIPMHIDPNQPDGANWEDRYGEFLGGVLGGVVPLGADVYHNLKRGGRAAYDWYMAPPLSHPPRIMIHPRGYQ